MEILKGSQPNAPISLSCEVYLSSLVTSRDPRRPGGSGGGEDEGGPGDIDFCLEDLLEFLDGVL